MCAGSRSLLKFSQLASVGKLASTGSGVCRCAAGAGRLAVRCRRQSGVGGSSQEKITVVSGALYSVENNGISADRTATLFLF